MSFQASDSVYPKINKANLSSDESLYADYINKSGINIRTLIATEITSGLCSRTEWGSLQNNDVAIDGLTTTAIKIADSLIKKLNK